MSTTIQIADKPTLDTVASNISSIKSTLSTVNSNVSTINSNVSSVESTLSTVNTNVTNIYDDVRTMSLQTDTIYANTGNILYNRTKGTKLNWRTISFSSGAASTTSNGKILGIFAKNNDVSSSGECVLSAGLQIIYSVTRANFISDSYFVSQSSCSTDLAPLFMCNDLFDYFTKISLLGGATNNVSTLFLPDNNYIPICNYELYKISSSGGYKLLSDENQNTNYSSTLSRSYVCAIGNPIPKCNSVILRKGDSKVNHTFFILEEAPE